MDPETRASIKQRARSVWLRAPVELLLERTQRRDTRPLLRDGTPREIIQRLLAEREPVYAEADLIVDSGDDPHHVAVERLLTALMRRGDLRE